MTLRQVIKESETKLKTYKDFVDTIEMLNVNKNDKKTLEFLLGIQKLELESKIMNVEGRLAKAKKDRLWEMEQQSSECLVKIGGVVLEAKKYVGQDPVGVTDKLLPLIDRFRNDGVWMSMSQEERNDVYFELKGHLNFLKTRLK